MVYFMENTITGWWLTYPSEKYELVSWDYCAQLNGKIKNVPNHQPELQISLDQRAYNLQPRFLQLQIGIKVGGMPACCTKWPASEPSQ